MDIHVPTGSVLRQDRSGHMATIMVSPRVNLAVSRSAGVDHARSMGWTHSISLYHVGRRSTSYLPSRRPAVHWTGCIYLCSPGRRKSAACGRWDDLFLPGSSRLTAAALFSCLDHALSFHESFTSLGHQQTRNWCIREMKWQGKRESFKSLNKEAFRSNNWRKLVQISLRICKILARNYKLLISTASVILRWVSGTEDSRIST